MIMKIRSQTVFSWISNDPGNDEFVVVDSKELTPESLADAASRFNSGEYVHGFVPIVFLDPELDSPVARAQLESQAGHRFLEWLSRHRRS